ncbi:MAG: methyltransferase domain-containing protein [Thermoplasmatota archaeon]
MSKVADVFDEWARQGRAEGMETGHMETAAPLLEGLRFEGGVRFLDLGCGNGWASRFAAQRGARCRGMDVSREMVDRANALAQKDRLNARYQVGDVHDLPFDDGSFDVAWSMEALYYAEDPDEVLREIKRVLTTGGTFHMLIDHYEENEASHGWSDMVGVPLKLRSEAEWAQAFQMAFFQDVQVARLRDLDAEGDNAWKAEHGTLYVSGRA